MTSTVASSFPHVSLRRFMLQQPHYDVVRSDEGQDTEYGDECDCSCQFESLHWFQDISPRRTEPNWRLPRLFRMSRMSFAAFYLARAWVRLSGSASTCWGMRRELAVEIVYGTAVAERVWAVKWSAHRHRRA